MFQQDFFFKSLSCDKDLLACETNTDSSTMEWKELKGAQSSLLLLKSTSNI